MKVAAVPCAGRRVAPTPSPRTEMLELERYAPKTSCANFRTCAFLRDSFSSLASLVVPILTRRRSKTSLPSSSVSPQSRKVSRSCAAKSTCSNVDNRKPVQSHQAQPRRRNPRTRPTSTRRANQPPGPRIPPPVLDGGVSAAASCVGRPRRSVVSRNEATSTFVAIPVRMASFSSTTNRARTS